MVFSTGKRSSQSDASLLILPLQPTERVKMAVAEQELESVRASSCCSRITNFRAMQHKEVHFFLRCSCGIDTFYSFAIG